MAVHVSGLLLGACRACESLPTLWVCFREPAIFGAVAPTGGRDPIFEAIKRTFSALDEEIIHVAEHSNVPNCQFGGTTALIALLIGQARACSGSGSQPLE